MEVPCFVRRRKSAAERRAQRLRSEARFLQRALNGLNDVHAHRGGTLTRFGWALRESLSRLGRGTEVPPSPAPGPSVPSPPMDDASPFHEGPAVQPSGVALSSDIADTHSVSPIFELVESVDAAVDMPMQFPEPPCSDVHVAAVQFSNGSVDEPHVVLEPSSSDVQVAAVQVSIGTGDEPEVVLPQQVLGNDVSEAVSVPGAFWGNQEVAQPQCFFVLADVRNYGAASKFALVTVKPFFFMVQHGMSFVRAVQAGAPDAPSKEIIQKIQDDAGGIKHDCNQQ